jgi:hypothetical protein
MHSAWEDMNLGISKGSLTWGELHPLQIHMLTYQAQDLRTGPCFETDSADGIKLRWAHTGSGGATNLTRQGTLKGAVGT